MPNRKRSTQRRYTSLRIEPLEPRLTLSGHPLMAVVEAHAAIHGSDGLETEAHEAMFARSSGLQAQTNTTLGSSSSVNFGISSSVVTPHDLDGQGGVHLSERTEGTMCGQEGDDDHGGQASDDDHEGGQQTLAAVTQTNLVSNTTTIAAAQQDPNLVDPTGIVRDAKTGMFFVANNGSGTITEYDSAGVASSTVITVPSPTSGVNGTPTALVLNHGTGFALKDGSASQLIVATDNGTIAAFGPSLANNTAEIEADNSASGADYTGLALGRSGGQTLLYAADFHNGTVDVFDTSFSKVTTLAGNFTDPGTDPLPPLPTGATSYAPFGITHIGGKLYVTFAAQDGTGHKVTGAGAGFIDVFDTDGTFVRRLATGGTLNAPWSVAVAPEGFSGAEHALIVANSGDGTLSSPLK